MNRRNFVKTTFASVATLPYINAASLLAADQAPKITSYGVIKVGPLQTKKFDNVTYRPCGDHYTLVACKNKESYYFSFKNNIVYRIVDGKWVKLAIFNAALRITDNYHSITYELKTTDDDCWTISWREIISE